MSDVHDPIYNNLYDPLRDTEGHVNDPYDLPDNVITEQTYLNTNAPHVSVHGYAFEIEPGEELEITYMVDTHRGAKCNSLEIDDTFTTIIKDEFGNILYKNTTYAGVFKVKLKPFMDGAIPLNGETWFSVECIDNHNVGSIVTFQDVWIHEPTVWTLFEPTVSWLINYGIKPGINTPTDGYNNKVLLTQLCSEISDGVYGNYNGLKLPKSSDGDTVYYLDPHLRKDVIPKPPIDNFYVYYRWREGSTTREVQKKIIPGLRVKFDDSNLPDLGYTDDTWPMVDLNESPLDFIRRDAFKAYRITQEDVANGNATSEDYEKEKIWVYWRCDNRGEFDDEHEKYTTGSRYLRTYKMNDQTKPLGFSYVVDRFGYGTNGGDCLRLPDHFMLDLNETNLCMVRAEDLQDADLIDIRENFDVHICNGRITGFFDINDSSPFLYHRFYYGYPRITSGKDFEVIRCLNTVASRYCTYDNLYISGSMCYESVLDSATDPVCYKSIASSGSTWGTGEGRNFKIRFDTVGYIDGLTDGKTIQQPNPIRENVSMEPRLPGNGDISLISTGGYIACDNSLFTKFPNEFYLEIRDAKALMYMGCGKHHEFFAYFYDSEYNFIGSVKSSFFRVIKTPRNTAYVKFTAYGYSVENNGVRTVPTFTVRHKAVAQDGTEYEDQPNWAFDVYVPFEIIILVNCKFTRCCSYIDCTWNNTRNLTLYPAGSRNCLYENCTWEQIFNGSMDSSWVLSPVMGDIEEGWKITDGLTLSNCNVTYEPEFEERPSDLYHHHRFNLNGAKNLTMINTNGIHCGFGQSEDAYFCGCKFFNFDLGRHYQFEHPCTVFRNCEVAGVTNLDSRTFYGDKVGNNWHHNTGRLLNGKLDNPGDSAYDYGTFRRNFCDDPPVIDLAVTDTFSMFKSIEPRSTSNNPDEIYNLILSRSRVYNKQHN